MDCSTAMHGDARTSDPLTDTFSLFFSLSRRNLVNTDLRASLAALRNGQEKLVQFRREKGRASSGRRRDLFQQLVVVGIVLLDDIDVSFATRSVKPFALRVIKQVVSVAGGREVAHHLSA